MFKVGDILEPYGITYKGCVVEVIETDETVTGLGNLQVKVLSHENDYWASEIEARGSFFVDSRYFKLKRDILFEEVI